MNNYPLISVIVPVYKAEAFLDRCVGSILNQTYSNLEIILVDDGSPDSCGKLCDEYAEQDSRVVVIHKENGGQSTARNMGLDAAHGDLIGFADSDDWIKPDMFSVMYANLIKYNADISCCGIEIVNDEGVYGYLHQNLNAFAEFNRKEALCELPDNQLISFSVYNKLYRREILDNIRFIEGMIYEDGVFADIAVGNTSKVVCSGNPLYCYYVASESTTRGKVSRKQLVDIIPADTMRIQYYVDNCPNVIYKMRNLYLKNIVDLLIESVGYSEFRKERLALRNEALKLLMDDNSYDYIKNHKWDIKTLKLSLDVFDFKKKVRG